MRPSFHPRLVNGPFDDPVLFIPFLFEKRAIMFDLGDIHSLSARDILKITHVFITHTHMDHFIGFDSLIRLLLGREKDLYLFGPEGFIKNVEGKLSGYSWNLVNEYKNRFVLHVTEVNNEQTITKKYYCNEKFKSKEPYVSKPFDGVLLREPTLTVFSEILDHKVFCLGFAIKEHFHINIKKDSLSSLGLEIGPWLKEFKEAVFNNKNLDSIFEVSYGREQKIKKKFILGELADKIAIITPGQKIAYITDCIYSPFNIKKIIKLSKDADHLFIEASFLENDKELAKMKNHLTAWQSGHIAGLSKVKGFTLFHFSPRYTGEEYLIKKEAKESYDAALKE
ncbi:MAG: ribonuclease Z [Desulfobacterales bacterium]|nr:ribonuclease Z [Desulfobacterales bacterium]MBF0397297.1 ribonuclease Z [Desulfobacterales bacterium]